MILLYRLFVEIAYVSRKERQLYWPSTRIVKSDVPYILDKFDIIPHENLAQAFTQDGYTRDVELP